MTRKVFHTFHYGLDYWRVQQIKNMGVVEGQRLLSSNKWEEVKRGGSQAIRKWIDDQMYDKSCQVVLIGKKTAGRRWVDYEIKKAWGDRKGVVGVYIHRLKDQNEDQSSKGANPFGEIEVDGKKLSSIVKCYNPGLLFASSKEVHDAIKSNLSDWVEEAIGIRNRY